MIAEVQPRRVRAQGCGALQWAIEVPLYRRIEPKAQCSSSSASSSRKSFCTATSSSNPGNDFFSEVMRITAYFTAGAAWPE
jgi:hypothetical protein